MLKQLLSASALSVLIVAPAWAVDPHCLGQLSVTKECSSEISGKQSAITVAPKNTLALAQTRVPETGAYSSRNPADAIMSVEQALQNENKSTGKHASAAPKKADID
jgi:hypothetical protein